MKDNAVKKSEDIIRSKDGEKSSKSRKKKSVDVSKDYRGSKEKKKKKKLKKGMEKRYKKGFKKGFTKGYRMGEINKAQEVARILVIREFSLDIISKVTGLTEEEINQL